MSTHQPRSVGGGGDLWTVRYNSVAIEDRPPRTRPGGVCRIGDQRMCVHPVQRGPPLRRLELSRGSGPENHSSIERSGLYRQRWWRDLPLATVSFNYAWKSPPDYSFVNSQSTCD
ncbi:hypothetical protein QJS10_CPB19g00257 [Acorus calamus]|uniref:Uncharacterized protein n=1 Tax=Acorus calamus TaxID=4465 RepID=A0AAV9CI23_ACOCL|nr:hypothetical protein QJS10_CPB19g00257 [Acorus calamus]